MKQQLRFRRNPTLYLLERQRYDVMIVGVAKTVYEALWATENLEKEGMSAEVIDLRTLVPLDKKTILNSVKKTGCLVVVDEDYKNCGMSGEIIATVVESGVSLEAPPVKIAYPDTPIPYSRVLKKYLPPVRGEK